MNPDQSPSRREAPGAHRNDTLRHGARHHPRAHSIPSIHDVSPVRRAIALAGGQSALARRIGVRPQSVQQWVANDRIPLNRTRDVAEALNYEMTIEELRPDYFQGASADGIE